MDKCSVLFEIGTECLNITWMSFGFKGLRNNLALKNMRSVGDKGSLDLNGIYHLHHFLVLTDGCNLLDKNIKARYNNETVFVNSKKLVWKGKMKSCSSHLITRMQNKNYKYS
jgi:hypothetical protein